MPKGIVCLTFDYDNVSHWIVHGATSPSPMSTGEFGSVATPRILRLLKRYGIRSSWYIPGHTIESFPDTCRMVVDAGHEIGHHGWTHRPPRGLSLAEETEELTRGIDSIVRLSGRRPRGYRSPAWDITPSTPRLLQEQGFRYDSSLMGDDYLPYMMRLPDVVSMHTPLVRGEELPVIEVPISWSLDDFTVFEWVYAEKNGALNDGGKAISGVLENWLADFLYMGEVEEFGILTYTMHPHIIGRGHRMIFLERLIQALIEHGAEFMTVEGALDAWHAVGRPRHLQF